jgi:hypothetical protein
MDTYSFGMLMWSLFHEQVPFDNDLAECTDYICEQSARPLILDCKEDEDDSDNACTAPMSRLIRKCWDQNA